MTTSGAPCPYCWADGDQACKLACPKGPVRIDAGGGVHGDPDTLVALVGRLHRLREGRTKPGSVVPAMIPAAINQWPIVLPDHRAARPEAPWWEAARLAAMHHVAQSMTHPHVYDIGAEEGDFPTLWATWGCRVIMAEPNPKSWPCIRATFEANNVEPDGWWVGLVGEETYTPEPHGHEGPLNYDGLRWWSRREWKDNGSRSSDPIWPECSEWPMVPDHGFQHLGEHREVTPVTTLDLLVGGFGPQPKIITMDVEGGELQVLRGAAATLRGDRYDGLSEFRPQVFVSVHPEMLERLYGQSRDDVLAFMDGVGYDATYLATDHEEHWWFSPR